MSSKGMNEQRELINQCETYRERGFFIYITLGTLKCLAFISCAFLLSALIEKSFTHINILAIISASIIIPLCSWIVKQSRYKHSNKQ